MHRGGGERGVCGAVGGNRGMSMDVEVTGIKKAYARKKVLTDISFSLEAGSCAAVLGSNGSGKSTLLSILAGVRKADGGSFLYRGTAHAETPDMSWRTPGVCELPKYFISL